ncbi:helix-turn-helix domain-containing protein [Kutzneria kofuensis]|uniref:Transcriptional regulator with XRE-family HTH domain n=1 Tax=Kutzneria kofuensis TaxID=103725 RepID=A0A7W9NFM5_9PSEU|nr:helix-turn-helix domain-containing protein [Kutzneria kofuensis]MBB5890271.1 transcriptional regulator with XRE-family HTH domain [Kutzneria kofuensis]
MSTDREQTSTVLSDRLNRLFDVRRPADSPEHAYTNREVVTGCKAAGFELSESHLSELRRGVKQNPTLRTLQAIASFFQVQVGYFTDAVIPADIDRELTAQADRLAKTLAANQAAQDELRAATQELQQAMRDSGVTKMAHRGMVDARTAREQASMMRALAKALIDVDDA